MLRRMLASVSPGRPIISSPLVRMPAAAIERTVCASRSTFARCRCCASSSSSPVSIPRLIIQQPARFISASSAGSTCSARTAQLNVMPSGFSSISWQNFSTRARWKVNWSS